MAWHGKLPEPALIHTNQKLDPSRRTLDNDTDETGVRSPEPRANTRLRYNNESMSFSVSTVCLIANGENGAAIAQNVNGQYTLLFAAVALVLALAMFFEYYRRRHSKLVVILAAVFMCTHPIWTVSATGGDLGYRQRDLALLWTVIVAAFFFVMYLRQPNRFNNQTPSSSASRQNGNAECSL